MESIEEIVNEVLYDQEKEYLIRMNRIYKIALDFYTKEQEILERVVEHVDKKSDIVHPNTLAKQIADFVVRKKYDKTTGTTGANVSPTIVACLIRDVTDGIDVYLAINFYFKSKCCDKEFEGWGNDQEFLEKEVKKKFKKEKSIVQVKNVHFLVPTGQGFMKNKNWKNRECHAEMQLLKHARDNFEKDWQNIEGSQFSIAVSKDPCIFCHMELGLGQGLLKTLYENASITCITNWVPPQFIELESNIIASSSKFEQTRDEIVKLKKEIEETGKNMKGLLMEHNEGMPDSGGQEGCMPPMTVHLTFSQPRGQIMPPKVLLTTQILRPTNIPDGEDYDVNIESDWEKKNSLKRIREIMKKKMEEIKSRYPNYSAEVTEFCEIITEMIVRKHSNIFEEFQELKKEADIAQFNAMSNLSKSSDGLLVLQKEIAELCLKVENEKVKENSDISLFYVLTFCNAVKILMNLNLDKDLELNIAKQILQVKEDSKSDLESKIKEMKDLAIFVGGKDLFQPKDGKGHWKINELKEFKAK